MEKIFFYIWFLYRKLIFRIFNRVDRSNGLAFSISFFVLLPLPVLTTFVLILKLNRHFLSKIYLGYGIVCLGYCIFLALLKENKKDKYFEEFNKRYNSTSRFKKILIGISLFYPLFYVILLIMLKRYFH